MKSSPADLQKRGYAAKEEIAKAAALPADALLQLLQSENAVDRTVAAHCLSAADSAVAQALLQALSVEACLYSKIAICECLEKGDKGTGEQMTAYLGKIGKNQYHQPPEQSSKKKSFPLPRDIIARTFGKMPDPVFSVLLQALHTGEPFQISEALDAVGYFVFYRPQFAVLQNVLPVFSVMEDYSHDKLLAWKCLLCLSAFPIPESREKCNQYAGDCTILGQEARRSLDLMQKQGR